jgi:hypothetical protein
MARPPKPGISFALQLAIFFSSEAILQAVDHFALTPISPVKPTWL